MKRLPNRTMPALLLVVGVVLVAAPALSAQDLPSADELIAKYVAASGGEAAIRSTKAVHAKGAMEMPSMGMNAPLEMFAEAPNRMLMQIEMPNMGAIKTGFDGEVGWVDNPMTGTMILEGDQLKDLLRQADFYADLNYAKNYPTRETVEQTEFAGRPAYKVRLVDEGGKELFEYFDAETGLKIGFEGEQTSEMGTVFVTSELSDYQEINGRKVPMTTVSKMMGMEMRMSFQEMSFDDIDDAVFELPDTVKTLLEQKEAKTGTDG